MQVQAVTLVPLSFCLDPQLVNARGICANSKQPNFFCSTADYLVLIASASFFSTFTFAAPLPAPATAPATATTTPSNTYNLLNNGLTRRARSTATAASAVTGRNRVGLKLAPAPAADALGSPRSHGGV